MTATPSAPFPARKQGAAPDAAARDRRDDFRYVAQPQPERTPEAGPARDAARAGAENGRARAAEPSMEELLASIRRIIAEEDLSSAAPRHEPGRGQDGVASHPRTAAERAEYSAPEPDLSPLDLPDGVLSESDPAFDLADEQPAPPPWPGPAAPATFRENRDGPVRWQTPERALQSPPPPRRPVPEEARPAPRAMAGEAPSADPRRSGAAEPRPAGLRDPAAPELPPRPAAAARPARSVSETLETMARSSFRTSDAPEATAGGFTPRPEPRAPRKDLLSPRADAVVSAAFESLGDLKLPQRERTVEDLVKEILRPMLKDWLDAYLPEIVERLVRAEIERVARSGRF